MRSKTLQGFMGGGIVLGLIALAATGQDRWIFVSVISFGFGLLAAFVPDIRERLRIDHKKKAQFTVVWDCLWYGGYGIGLAGMGIWGVFGFFGLAGRKYSYAPMMIGFLMLFEGLVGVVLLKPGDDLVRTARRSLRARGWKPKTVDRTIYTILFLIATATTCAVLLWLVHRQRP